MVRRLAQDQWQLKGQNFGALDKEIAKRLAAFERKAVKGVSGGTKVRRYNKELIRLLGDFSIISFFNILSFVRVSRLNLCGNVNRMDSTRKVSQVCKNNAQGSRIRGRPKKKDGGTVN
jgi:hypothetical protein